jgi:hypothetical protein
MAIPGLTFGTPEKRPEATRVFLPAIEYRRRKRFLMMIEPDSFDWDRTSKEYLPTLMKLPLIPGVGGVKKGRDPSAAIAFRTGQGRTVIYDGDHRLKMPGDPCPLLAGGRYRTEYLARIGKTNSAGVAYGWAWEGFELAGKVVIWGQDDDKRRRFLRHVATILPAMSPAVRRLKYRMAEGQYKRARGRQDQSAAADDRLAIMTGVLEDLLADLEKHTDMGAKLTAGAAGALGQVDENGDPVVDIEAAA